MINKKILTRAEYTSLGISALGTIIAATTGQIAYVTSPLICSLFLNVVNRNKLDNRISHNITHQIASVKDDLNKNNHSLVEQIRNLENTLNSKDNSKDYQQKIETLQSNFNKLNNPKHSNETISQLIKQELDKFNYFIRDNRPEYQLIFDRRGSRNILLKTLQKAQERIILVCPWITYYGADNEVIKYCRAFLDKGGCIDIGWGHLKDIKQTKHISISRDEFIITIKNNNNYWG